METGFAEYRSSISFSLLVFICLLCSTATAQTPEWWEKLKKTKPTVTTRSEVENLFAPSVTNEDEGAENNKTEDGWSTIVRYRTQYGWLEATYSTGRCAETAADYAYDIERGVLVQLILQPVEFPSARALGLDLRSFQAERVNDIPGSFRYHDDRSGLTVNVYKGKVREVELNLSKAQLRLRCKKRLNGIRDSPALR